LAKGFALINKINREEVKMEKILTNGERICKSLLNPTSKDIAASEWLLLFTIYKNNNIRSRDVSEKLSENWKKVHAENPNFYVIWSTGFETDKELIRYEDIGILKIADWMDEEPCWSLTERGEKVLNDWKDNVKEILGSIVQTLQAVEKVIFFSDPSMG